MIIKEYKKCKKKKTNTWNKYALTVEEVMWNLQGTIEKNMERNITHQMYYIL